MPQEARDGDTVAIIYTGRLKDGTVFDSNEGHEPLTFRIGEGEVIEGFERAVRGLAVGAKRSFEVAPDAGYGARDEGLVIKVMKRIFVGGKPAAGMEVAVRGRDGTVFNGRIQAVKGDLVHVDLNHPLAGETVVFDVQVVKVG